jgi:predicted nucleic acid-binding protein
LVLDASVSASWLLDDELDPEAATALEWVRGDGAVVPNLWHYEVRNALLVAERRGRVGTGLAKERLTFLRDLHIHTDQEPDLEAAMDIATTHGLSFYDAAYVELGRRRSLPLATLDGDIVRAALAEGIEVVPA